MPAYEIEYITPLKESQKDQLAEAVTSIHSNVFTIPSLLVNVRFTDVTKHDTYVGGKKRSSNRIFAYVRAGGGRTMADFNTLCQRMIKAWDDTVNDGKEGKGDKELRAIFVLGAVVAGSEAGLTLPSAGEDKEWLKDNMHVFQKRADDGDEDFKLLMEEINTRSDFSDLRSH